MSPVISEVSETCLTAVSKTAWAAATTEVSQSHFSFNLRIAAVIGWDSNMRKVFLGVTKRN